MKNFIILKKMRFIIIVLLIKVVSFTYAGAFSLPDTGQTKCYSDKGKIKVITCPKPGASLAQDGSYIINPPSYTVNADGTVLDNNTFLMWEQDDGWMCDLTFEQAKNFCDNFSLGGYTDWRLPTSRELTSIVNFSKYNPAIDLTAFPTTKGFPYWTATTDVCNMGNTVTVNFTTGEKSAADPVLARNVCVTCVRGGRLSYAKFVNNQNGTISDLSTGLMWQQNGLNAMGWGAALNYCENLTPGGYSDWRLPNIKEMESLTFGTQQDSSIFLDYFTYGTNFPYWSSTTYIGMSDLSYRWVMDHLENMSLFPVNDRSSSNLYVRCVRSQQSTPLDNSQISLSSSVLDFWKVRDNGVTSADFIVSNMGKGDLTIGMITRPSLPFAIVADNCSGNTLSSSKSCYCIVTFSTNQEGSYTDIMTIPSNDTDQPVVTVDLKGTVIGEFFLPDTGEVNCYNADGNLINCPPPGASLAQDASYMMNQLSYTLNSNGTITDNNTGLIWQREDDGIARSWDEAVTYCKNLNLGEYSDWRLPVMMDLITIIDYGRYNPSIDSSVFLNTQPQQYWSFTSTDTYNDDVWTVNFSDGTLWKNSRSANLMTRCVRGSQMPSEAFLNNGDGTTTDLLTGLMWMQNDTVGNWETAINYCECLSLAGYSDWRLPNVKELISIADARYRPAINPSFFPVVSCDYWYSYWSSTTYPNTPYYSPADAYGVSFKNGPAIGLGDKKLNINDNIRCVRGGTTKQPSAITGTVMDLSNNLPISSVLVTVTDSSKTATTISGSDGKYTIENVTPGSFTATFTKSGYLTQTVNGTLLSGQTLTLDIQMTPTFPLTIAITSPVDGAVVSSSPISVSGNVTNNAQVTVNGIQATVTSNTFSVSINLVEGQNTITAVAQDQYGQAASHSIVITLRVPRPPVISDIVADSITANSVTITWTTDQSSNSVAEYGETAEYGSTVSDLTLTTNHSIRLDALKPDTTYHFKVTSKNTDELSSSSGDFTFTTLTPPFTVSTLGDYGNVLVMEVSGNYDSRTPDGSINALPRQEVAKEFLRTHQDSYDFFVVFSNFDFSMPDTAAKEFYLEVKNDTQGTGKTIFDNTSFFGSNGKLQGTIDMGNVLKLITNPADPKFEETINNLVHEQMHRWGAYVKFKDAGGNISTALLGKDNAHWSFLLDSDGSVMYGNDWKDNGDSTFTSMNANKYYSPLDLYLMGMYDKSQVPPMLLIDNPAIDPTKLPEIGTTITGTARSVTIDDIIAAEGERLPNASTSQKTFKTAFILITRPGTFTGNELPGIENVRNAWAGKFVTLTNGKGSIADVAPSITLSIACPIDSETISGNDVMVRGAIINNTGNETGVTVNGVIATVYGNQFMANVPLVEGQNTITVTATDTDGNTATTSITVNAVTTGNYIRLTSNIESGIAPLETTLRIDASFSITDSNMNATGPVQPEITFINADEYTVKLTIEGMYFITASVNGPDGNTYQDTIVITVLNKMQLDNLLKGKWEGMRILSSLFCKFS